MARHRRCKWSLRSIKIVKVYKYNVFLKHSLKRITLNLGLTAGHLGYFRCNKCDRGFGQKGTLLVHNRSHSNSKPYVCVKCKRRFVTQGGLVTHNASHKMQQIKPRKIDRDKTNLNQNKQNQKNILSPFLRGQRSNKTRRVMGITHDSTGKESSKELFGENLVKSSVATKDVSSNNRNVKNKTTEVIKRSARLARKRSAVVDQNTSKSVRLKKKIPKDIKKPKPVKIKCQDTTSYRDDISDDYNDDGDYDGDYSVLEKSNPSKVMLPTEKSDNRMVTRSRGKRKELLTSMKRSRKCQVKKSTPKTIIKSNVVEDAYSTEEESSVEQVPKKDLVKKVHLERDTNSKNQIHFAKKVYQCEICSKMCSDSSQLRSHRRLHTGEKPFACKMCDKSFRMKACLNVHVRVHTGEKPYHCSTCSKDFRYQNTFNKHVATHQANLEKQIKCKICDKHFLTRESLWDHKQKLRKCDMCPQMFCSFSTLNIHKHKNHVDTFSVDKSDGKYCRFCKKTFKSNYTYFVHMQKHARKGMPIKFPCQFCSESFDSYDQLRIHRKSHIVKRDKCVTCPWSHCGKKLTSQTRLDSHLKRHGQTQYLCYRCGMNFTDCVFYLKHRRACYQRIIKYDCVICGKLLSGHSALQKHILSHKGEKPCQCEICGARFNNSSHLKRHKRIHIRKGEMPPFENDTKQGSRTRGAYLCIPAESMPSQPEPQQLAEFGFTVQNNQVVAYFIDKEAEQVELKSELMSATANVTKEMK